MNRIRKKYTLIYLIDKQSKAFKKHKDFHFLIDSYNAARELKKLSFGRKCYSTLNKAEIIPSKLNAFYNAFSLPQSIFFPVFLKIKKDCIAQKTASQKKRDLYILKKMAELPEDVRSYLVYFSKYEKSLNGRKRFPVWEKSIYPMSKKAADKLAGFSQADWADYFFNYTDLLKDRYKKFNEVYANKIIALFILELPIKKHTGEDIKRQFRKLSKIHHPDAGGTALNFNLLQKAKEIML